MYQWISLICEDWEKDIKRQTEWNHPDQKDRIRLWNDGKRMNMVEIDEAGDNKELLSFT